MSSLLLFLGDLGNPNQICTSNFFFLIWRGEGSGMTTPTNCWHLTVIQTIRGDNGGGDKGGKREITGLRTRSCLSSKNRDLKCTQKPTHKHHFLSLQKKATWLHTIHAYIICSYHVTCPWTSLILLFVAPTGLLTPKPAATSQATLLLKMLLFS